eukprot:6383050-Prymnesium_polylepis.1
MNCSKKKKKKKKISSNCVFLILRNRSYLRNGDGYLLRWGAPGRGGGCGGHFRMLDIFFSGGRA